MLGFTPPNAMAVKSVVPHMHPIPSAAIVERWIDAYFLYDGSNHEHSAPSPFFLCNLQSLTAFMHHYELLWHRVISCINLNNKTKYVTEFWNKSHILNQIFASPLITDLPRLSLSIFLFRSKHGLAPCCILSQIIFHWHPLHMCWNAVVCSCFHMKGIILKVCTLPLLSAFLLNPRSRKAAGVEHTEMQY